ncbi:MAG: HIT domain-containing protein [Candidatus Marinimicrobia bacterium]|jgi:ATP adenylyltransferase|nr:HIT domain-containing protein [Candidatus Neomarinimicrobiota bacterium]MBT4635140.1 HIT domain-containing protein [Candidatus Neomarinimicrobiota bacterium]MBT4735024.1 HIT domain-containing protein [Candidatus Neomarinimicrobiota bacterium]MBT6471981.1 HIT domain-containing protein [Candidatus Neomarinimicrobiota bacterium]MBT7270730.1 HIT domain-containing protein [Candidatus Neomarinimicrobiota bacterium]
MDRLWAPWRIDYIRSPKEDGCIFCNKPEKNDDQSSLILARGKHSYVLMNLYPYNNAHLMVAPYSHESNTQSLSPETLSEIIWFSDKTMEILKEKLSAEGFNFGANIGSAGGAGIEEHIHFHIVPRWSGDTNFMPVLGHTKVQVQGLEDTYDHLLPAFNQLMEKI